jgi:hypothetical protein
LSDILETLFERKRNSIASSSTNYAICPNDVPKLFASVLLDVHKTLAFLGYFAC